MKITAVIICALSFVPSPALSQEKQPTKKDVRTTKSAAENVDFLAPWDVDEIKTCATYSGQPMLLICDDTKIDWPESFINLMSNYAAQGMPEEKAYHRAFLDVTVRSKQFPVEFRDEHGRDPEPWPEPQVGLKMTAWECEKTKPISCTLIGRE